MSMTETEYAIYWINIQMRPQTTSVRSFADIPDIFVMPFIEWIEHSLPKLLEGQMYVFEDLIISENGDVSLRSSWQLNSFWEDFVQHIKYDPWVDFVDGVMWNPDTNQFEPYTEDAETV